MYYVVPPIYLIHAQHDFAMHIGFIVLATCASQSLRSSRRDLDVRLPVFCTQHTVAMAVMSPCFGLWQITVILIHSFTFALGQGLTCCHWVGADCDLP